MALMRRPEGGPPEEVTPAAVNVRTRVHEYGGGSWTLAAHDLVLFADFADQRLYRQRLGEQPVAITPDARHARRPALRRLPPRRRRPHRGRVREVHGEGEAENRSSRSSSRAAVSRGCSPAAATSTPSRAPAPTAPRSPSPAGITPTCPGTGPSCGSCRWPTPAPRRRLAGGRSESIFQPEWDADGRLHFVSDRDGWWNLFRRGRSARCRGRGRGRSDNPRGGRPRPPAVALRRCQLRLPRRRRDRRRPHASAAKNGWRCSSPRAGGVRDLGLPYTSFGFPSLLARGERVAFAAASPESEPAIAIFDNAAGGGSRPSQVSSEETIDPGLRLAAAGDRLPDQRRRHRARLLLPAGQRRLRGAAGGAAAADRPEPRRPDLPRDPRPRPRVPLLDQPRLRRRRRQLPRLQRLRARLPAGAERDLGDRRHRRLHRRRPPPGRERRGRRRAAGDPRRLGRRLRDPLRARLPRRLRRRRQLLRRRRRRDPGPRHPQVRVALPRRPDRPLSRARRPLPRALADPLRRAAARAGDPLPGTGGRDRPAQPGGDDGRGAEPPTASPTPTSPSRASSTASAARRRRSAASKPSSPSTADPRLRARRCRWPRWRSPVSTASERG